MEGVGTFILIGSISLISVIPCTVGVCLWEWLVMDILHTYTNKTHPVSEVRRLAMVKITILRLVYRINRISGDFFNDAVDLTLKFLSKFKSSGKAKTK